jgi:hypothetical protein
MTNAKVHDPWIVYWETYSRYTNGAPELQTKGFMTLDAALSFGRELEARGHLIHGVHTGSTRPIIDRDRRKAWISRRRRSEPRHW